MSIKGVQGTESTGYEVAVEEKEEAKKADLKIHSYARPKICTAFQEVKKLDDSRVTVILSDGSMWDVNPLEDEDAFESIYSNWKVGDDIRIRKDDDLLVLKNVREKTAFFATLSKKCDDLSKAFFIEKVDCTGYALKTKAGEIFVAGYMGSFTTQHWSEGQRIIINKSTHSGRYEDYEIFNADTGSSLGLPKFRSNFPIKKTFRKKGF